MASTLPSVDPCCTATCDDAVVQNVPGPAGDDGAAGAAGAAGQSAVTTLTVAFTMPAELASATATVASTAWMGVNEIVYIETLGYLQCTAVLTGTTFTAKNLESAGTSAYLSNAAAGTIAPIGSKVTPGGLQGPQGSVAGGTLVGDSTGTIGANQLTIAGGLGALPVGNGTHAQSLAKGTDGYILAADAAAALDLVWKHSLPITGDAVLADNRIGRLDGATGLPIPIQSSKVTINDQGAITADGSGGNARGTDAVDLQVTRGAAAQVASGARAVIAGGDSNTAGGLESFVGGGDSNSASNNQSVVCGGDTNLASGDEAAVLGGNGNGATGSGSCVGGGRSNLASGLDSTIGGGLSNVASNDYATVAGGVNCQATATHTTIIGGSAGSATAIYATAGGGLSNFAQAIYSTAIGGASNNCLGAYSAILGGTNAKTSLHGQITHSSDQFANQGDAQTSDLLWNIATTDATANVEMFLDGGGVRAILPANTSWRFDIQVVVRTSAGLDAFYTSIGIIRNNAGVTTASAITTTEVFDGAGLPATPVTVDADAGNNALRIRVTGIVATNIRWVARARLVEVNY